MSRYCGLCGGLVLPEDSFCANCGARISSNTPQAISAPEPPRSVAPPAAPVPPPAPRAVAAPLASVPPPVARAAAPPPPSAPAAPRTAVAPPPVAPPPTQAPEKMWHFILNGATTGPVPEAKLREILQGMPGNTMVWNPSLPEWKTAEMAGLKPPVVAPPPVINAPPASPAPMPPPIAPTNRNLAPAMSPPPPAVSSFPSAFQAPAMPPPGPPVMTSSVSSMRPPGLAAPQPGSPIPPNMHWLVVLILSCVTCGLGGLIWMFKEAFFVKKLDSTSKAPMLFGVMLVSMVIQIVVGYGAASGSMMIVQAASLIVLLLNFVIFITGLVAVFSMRKSISTYYNTIEPIGLKLSGVMTFFFSILYFQYHFSRINEWKKTGHLPQ